MSHGENSPMQSSALKDMSGICANQQSLFVVVSISPVILCRKRPWAYQLKSLMNYREPSSKYGLSPAEVRSYWEGMDALLQNVKIWPQPQDLLRDGSQCYLKHLERVASEITHTKRPDMVLVNNPVSPSIIEDENFHSGIECDQENCGSSPSVEFEDMVIKRTFSSSHQHVFRMTGSTDYQAIIKEKMDDTARRYGYFGDWIKPVWFATPYIDSMKFGELRAIFVGGHLIFVLSTKRNEGVLSVNDAAMINPLSSLK